MDSIVAAAAAAVASSTDSEYEPAAAWSQHAAGAQAPPEPPVEPSDRQPGSQASAMQQLVGSASEVATMHLDRQEEEEHVMSDASVNGEPADEQAPSASAAAPPVDQLGSSDYGDDFEDDVLELPMGLETAPAAAAALQPAPETAAELSEEGSVF
jgi:hypothetical protein